MANLLCMLGEKETGSLILQTKGDPDQRTSLAVEQE
jgi:hypothetical protein